jgi:RNA recognition motif-containing protein
MMKILDNEGHLVYFRRRSWFSKTVLIDSLSLVRFACVPSDYSVQKTMVRSWHQQNKHAVSRQRNMNMSKKIYVGNLNYATTEDTLSSLFAQYGEVVSSVIIKDRYTEQSKGFGFIEMADDAAADAAIATLNGKEVDGRRVRVNVAEEKPRTNSRGPRNFNHDGGNRDGGRDGGDRY